MVKRHNDIAKGIGSFLQQYQRKAQRGVEPNDRGYDRSFEKKIKAMNPEELSEVMHGDTDSNIPHDIDEKWFSNEPIDGVAFGLNDSVSIIAGPYAGKGGAIIFLSRLVPEPEYYIELGSGEGDIKVFQSNLRKIT